MTKVICVNVKERFGLTKASVQQLKDRLHILNSQLLTPSQQQLRSLLVDASVIVGCHILHAWQVDGQKVEFHASVCKYVESEDEYEIRTDDDLVQKDMKYRQLPW